MHYNSITILRLLQKINDLQEQIQTLEQEVRVILTALIEENQELKWIDYYDCCTGDVSFLEDFLQSSDKDQ